jgi:hypothetical protein
MTKLASSIVCSALVAALSLTWMTAAVGKQQCSAAMPTTPHGYWSWRLIDGRKCWYEGKPMLSKSLLEWSARPAAQSDSDGGPATTRRETPGDPMNSMDSMANTPTDLETFEALWRARVEGR